MDIFTHAIIGAATGAQYNEPVLGAVIAIIPDLPLIGKRRQEPTELYKYCHSFLGLLTISLLLYAIIDNFELCLACLVSHIVLDLPTHSAKWNPRLFYPNNCHLQNFKEWEFFNNSWFLGLGVSIIWTIVVTI